MKFCGIFPGIFLGVSSALAALHEPADGKILLGAWLDTADSKKGANGNLFLFLFLLFTLAN